MKSEYRQKIKVGLFVGIGLVIIIAAILLIGNINDSFTKKAEIVTVFDDVKGLKEGNNIWFSGVKIGTVSKLEFIDGSRIKLTLSIDSDVMKFIKKDAQIKLGTDGLIGNKLLIISGGSLNMSHIEEGDTLIPENTLSTEDILNMLQKNNVNILEITTNLKDLVESINEGSGTLGKLIKSDSVYNNLLTLSTGLESSILNASVVMNDLAEFSGKLNKNGTLLDELLTDTTLATSLQASFANLEQFSDSATILISKINKSTTDTTSTVGVLMNDYETGIQIKSTISNLKESSVLLNENLEAIQHNFLLRKYFKNKEKETSEKQ